MLASPFEPRVLHVNDQTGWRGGEQQMVYLADGLRRRSVQTAIVVPPGGGAVEKARRAALDVREMAMCGETDLVAAFRIARMARTGHFNIIHSHTAHAHTLAVLAARLFMANAHVVAHRRIEFPVGRRLFGLGKLKYRFGVSAYVAVCNRMKETLMEAGVPEWRIFVVRSATDPSRFLNVRPDPHLRERLGIPANAFVIGNIGALVPHKDHRTLLEASRIVRDKIMPFTWVVIVGDGPLRESILAKAESLHMTDRLVMTGFRWDIPQLIRTFDVFAISSSEEGICSTLLEVAASGCPIVATDVGGIREAVLPEETGIIVPARSPKSFAQAILRLIENPQDVRRMVRAGRERVVKHFNTDVLTERTLEVYARVLKGQVGQQWPVGFLAD